MMHEPPKHTKPTFQGFFIFTGCLICILCCFYPGVIRAQNFPDEIHLSLKKRTLLQVFQELQHQAGISFSYNPQVIDVEQQVSYECLYCSPEKALDRLLHPLGYSWTRIEQQIVIRKQVVPADDLVRIKKPPAFTISGFVRDASSGDILIGATVRKAGSHTGTTTNAYGYYVLTLPAGLQSVEFSYVGFKSVADTFRLSGDTVISANLEETIMGMREVVISARTETGLPAVNQPGDFSFSGATLEKLPGFAGEPDVLKALQVLPGIRSFGDGSSYYYVRGGKNDQNLLMIDDAPIYNPSHLFGFFSVLSPDAVNDMEVYKGDFPARYGGKTSSVIAVTAREGNDKRFGIRGNLGPFASTITVEGPIKKNQASFLVSGRLSTLNWLNYLVDDEGSFNLWFYDINAKVNARISGKDRIYATFFTGKDMFKRYTESVYRTYGNSWNNLAGALRWTHIFLPKLFLNTTLSYSQYNYFLYLSADQEDYWTSSIGNATIKSDLTWFLNDRNRIEAGFSVSRYHSQPGKVIEEQEEQLESRDTPPYTSAEYVFFAGNRQRIGEHLTLEYGLRVPVWQDFGPTTVYYFDANHQVIDTVDVARNRYYDLFVSPEPRFSMGVKLWKEASLKASYTRTTQFLQLISNATGPFTSLDIWAPAGPNIPPLKCDQVSLGLFGNLASGKFQFSAEGFYKYYHDNLDYTDHANLLYNPLMESQIRIGDAWSYGVELMLRKPLGKLTGWIGYTWSRAFIHTPEVNDGNVYPASWDAPNNLCVFLTYDTRKRWSFSASWVCMTGNPITTPTGFYWYNGSQVPVYGAKNNDRLPDYHRLDLSAMVRLNHPGSRFQHQLAMTLYNAYGRANPFSLSFNKTPASNGKYVVPSNLNLPQQQVPTLISVAGIIPSINYQFKF